MDQLEIAAINNCRETNKTNFHTINNEKGFSLLELVVVITIIGALLVIAVEKLLTVQVSAEQVAMQQVLGSLKSAMSLNIAAHIADQNIKGLVDAENTNPMDWLSEKPDNYIGTLNEPDPTDIKGFNWYYDTYSQTLVYRVSNQEYFKTSLNGAARARFKVKLDYTDSNANGLYEKDIDEITGLQLISLNPYEWTNEALTTHDYEN